MAFWYKKSFYNARSVSNANTNEFISVRYVIIINNGRLNGFCAIKILIKITIGIAKQRFVKEDYRNRKIVITLQTDVEIPYEDSERSRENIHNAAVDLFSIRFSNNIFYKSAR